MAKSRSNSNSGFSLLEVIIAVGILSVAITVILQSLSYSARITGLNGDISEAVLLARDKLQELEFAQGRGGLSAGIVSGVKNKFSWSYDLVETDAVSRSFKADFEVNWDRMNQRQSIRFSSDLRNY
ncbi:MAG: type II secretion system protein [Candidatus Omnitrophica bacterium]|nr:type II secretion system protein [Candidatus Omnitrophota bacterium]